MNAQFHGIPGRGRAQLDGAYRRLDDAVSARLDEVSPELDICMSKLRVAHEALLYGPRDADVRSQLEALSAYALQVLASAARQGLGGIETASRRYCDVLVQTMIGEKADPDTAPPDTATPSAADDGVAVGEQTLRSRLTARTAGRRHATRPGAIHRSRHAGDETCDEAPLFAARDMAQAAPTDEENEPEAPRRTLPFVPSVGKTVLIALSALVALWVFKVADRGGALPSAPVPSAVSTVSASPSPMPHATPPTATPHAEPPPPPPLPSPLQSSPPAMPAMPAVPDAPGVVLVKASAANIRASMSKTAAILKVVDQGIYMRAFQRRDEWILVGEADPFGWVHESVVDILMMPRNAMSSRDGAEAQRLDNEYCLNLGTGGTTRARWMNGTGMTCLKGSGTELGSPNISERR